MSDQPRVEIYTKERCGYCKKAKDLFDSKNVSYEEYNVTGDKDRFEEMVDRSGGRRTAPEVFVAGTLIGGWDELHELDARGDLDELLEIGSDEDVVDRRRLIIAGSGIAGLTAAIYAGRSNNDPLVIEGTEPGGQLTLTTDVANYPGFPEGISGPDLINRMKQQAERFGAEIKNGVIDRVETERRPYRVTLRNGAMYETDALIAASGASARTLGIPGEDDLMGYGVSTCATCDGAFFRDEEMLVVGGGDAAMEEANFLTKFAKKVYIAHRREKLRAEDYWTDRIREQVEHGTIELLLNTELLEIHGSTTDGISHVTLLRHPDGHPSAKLSDPDTERFEMDVGAVFLAIGHTPNTSYLAETEVRMDADGYIKTKGGSGGGQTKTDVPGIFGAGDVVDFHYQQAITAGGMGCEAAIDADDYLDELDRQRTRRSKAELTVESND